LKPSFSEFVNSPLDGTENEIKIGENAEAFLEASEFHRKKY
jgi:hypothetical protein